MQNQCIKCINIYAKVKTNYNLEACRLEFWQKLAVRLLASGKVSFVYWSECPGAECIEI